ncbi:MAG: triose-phosphate isomerase [Chitinophagaceae bacterium]|nr:MAG: triose-phosphate isomerase [Chitinophagaceae bacterium]
MRKQIAAANWKMNLTIDKAAILVDSILENATVLQDHQRAIFAVPAPYLSVIKNKLVGRKNIFVAAQNCHHKASGAYTGEVSVEMLSSLGIPACIVGHSERREYFNETNEQIAEKINLLLAANITPVFCCGEPLEIRESEGQNEFVATQIKESLFHLSENEIKKLVIAYEPIWAIGTGKTATTQQAQEIQAYIRSVLADQYGFEVADAVSILYGGSVKAANAKELFASNDVDGGLVGGASLIADEFVSIMGALK